MSPVDSQPASSGRRAHTKARGASVAARGFTLLELTAVLTIIAILVSMAVPVYTVYLHRARGTEALLQLETISYLEEVRVLELGAPIALPPNPTRVPGLTPHPFEPHPAWADIGLRIEGPMYFQYRVDVDSDDHFTVHATGDVDGDGRPTRLWLSSRDLRVHRHVDSTERDETP